MGGGGGSAPVKTSADTELKEEKKEAKKARSSLFATEGGVLGAKLQDEDVKERQSLLGN
jgi:hypothetical protein